MCDPLPSKIWRKCSGTREANEGSYRPRGYECSESFSITIQFHAAEDIVIRSTMCLRDVCALSGLPCRCFPLSSCHRPVAVCVFVVFDVSVLRWMSTLSDYLGGCRMSLASRLCGVATGVAHVRELGACPWLLASLACALTYNYRVAYRLTNGL